MTLPAWGSLNCGMASNSVCIDADNSYLIESPAAFALGFTTAFSYECWIKPTSYGELGNSILIQLNNALGPFFSIVTVSGVFGGFITTTVSSYVVSGPILPVGEWSHIAVTWSSTSNSLKFYVNGILVSSITTAGVLVSSAGHWIVGFFGYINELRIWNEERTPDQINNHKASPQNTTDGDGVNDGLRYYWRFNQGSGNPTCPISGRIIKATLDLVNTVTPAWSSTEFYPRRYGASFIPGQFAVALSSKSALRFPVIPPANANFGLYVSWLDDDGETLHRRRLFAPATSQGVVDIAPAPADYAGETLAANYTIEVWNIDGKPTVNLASDIVLQASTLTCPLNNRDVTPVAAPATAPVIDSTLAQNFPLTGFPLTFNTQQVYS